MWIQISKMYLIAVIFVVQIAKTSAQRFQKYGSLQKPDTRDLYEYLSKHYDRHSPPINSSKPLEISFSITVESFDNIEETSMEYSLYVYITQRWTDHRLKNLVNRSTVINRKDIESIWKPDTYCLNARQSDLMMPDDQAHSMLILDRRGHILYSRGSYLKTSCMMDLRDFPMDEQRCSMHFASYGYSMKYVVYKWDNHEVAVPNSLKELAQFVLVGSTISARNSTYTSGNFTILTATFLFQRRLGYYLLQIYIPCTFLVMLSWIAFWMDKNDTGNRLTVGVTTILTIMFLLGYSNSSVPKMSYVKAMDVYLLSSFAFIFFSLIETVLCWRFEKEPEKKETNKGHLNHFLVNEAATVNEPSRQRTNSKRSFSDNYNPKTSSNPEIDEILLQKIGKCLDRLQAANRHVPTEPNQTKTKCPRISLDTVARISFPVAFGLFNIIYWSVWTTGHKH